MTAKASPARRGLRRRWIRFPHRRSSTPPDLTRVDVPESHLSDGWLAFRRVSVGDDHAPLVVASVRGAFVVEAFDASETPVVIRNGEIVVAGTSRPDVAARTSRQARLLQEYLAHPVEPLIVVAGTAASPQWVDKTRVLAMRDLRSFLVNATGPRMTWDEFKQLRARLGVLSG